MTEYRCATYEEAEALGYDETSSVLLRPDGTVLAALMEPEDRSWYRDGAPVVVELNALGERLRLAEARALEMAAALREVAESSIDDHWLRERCADAFTGAGAALQEGE